MTVVAAIDQGLTGALAVVADGQVVEVGPGDRLVAVG